MDPYSGLHKIPIIVPTIQSLLSTRNLYALNFVAEPNLEDQMTLKTVSGPYIQPSRSRWNIEYTRNLSWFI